MLHFQARVADAHDAFGGGGDVADAELEVGQAGAADGEGVGDVVAAGARVVDVVDLEDAVDVVVRRGFVRVVGAGDRAGDVAARGVDILVVATEARGGGVGPEVAAAGVEVEAKVLRGRAEGDVGEVEASALEIVESLRDNFQSSFSPSSLLVSLDRVVDRLSLDG